MEPLPKRVPAHGKLPRDVVNRIVNNFDYKGGQLWYTCKSCNRTVRIKDKAKHIKEYHYKVFCEGCQKGVDHFSFRFHQEQNCTGRRAFCKYCSLETTFGELAAHHENCSEAKRYMLPKIDRIEPPTNFTPSIPAFNALVDLAEAFSLNRDDDDLSRPAQLLEACKLKYGPGTFPVKPKDKNKEKEKQRKQEMAKRLNDFVAKSGRDAVQCYSERWRDLRLEDEIDLQTNKVVANPYHPMHRNSDYFANLRSMNLQSVKDQIQVQDQRGQFVRDFHKLESQFTRFEARQRARKKKEKELSRRCINFQKSLKLEQFQKDKKYVINQAVQLEKQQSKLDRIPEEDWNRFINELKGTRPVWPDLGLKVKDCELETEARANAEVITKNMKVLSCSNYNNEFKKQTKEEDASSTDEGDCESVVTVFEDTNPSPSRRSYHIFHR